MKRILATLILGILVGICATIVGPVLADVTLNTSISKKTDAQGVRGYRLVIQWAPDSNTTGETTVSGKVFALDSGIVQPGAITDIDVFIPADTGAAGSGGPPVFGVTGFYADAGGVASCSGTRTGILASLNSIKADWETFANNCLN